MERFIDWWLMNVVFYPNRLLECKSLWARILWVPALLCWIPVIVIAGLLFVLMLVVFVVEEGVSR